MSFGFLFLSAFAYATGDLAFEDAVASSTFAAGSHNAAQALSAGSGYWSSAGSHGGETVVFTGTLAAATSIKGLEITWSHAPSEVRVLTSADGGDFEEAACWKPTGKSDESFTETLMFSQAMKAKSVAIAMRGARASGYFGIGEVSVLSAGETPVMITSGATSASELCVVVANGQSSAGSLLTLESCDAATAAGDGRELWIADSDGQLKSAASGLCAALAGNNALGGGVVALTDCRAAAQAGDGRSFFSFTSAAQLSLARGGGYCVTLTGALPAADEDAAASGSATATASLDSEHLPAAAIDGSSETFWASPEAAGPVGFTIELADVVRVKSVVIEWKTPPTSFVVEVGGDGPRTVFASVNGNALSRSTLTGATALAKTVHIRMTGGSGSYGISSVRVLAAPLKLGVADCSQIAQSGDARDKFFPQPVAEFDSAAAAPINSAAPLLSSALHDLGAVTAELVASLPKLESCSPSLLEGEKVDAAITVRTWTELESRASPAPGSIDAAIGAISIGADEESLASSVSAAVSALAPYSFA